MQGAYLIGKHQITFLECHVNDCDLYLGDNGTDHAGQRQN